jgi:signal transduction histidine kinase
MQGLVNWIRGRTMSFSTRIQIFLNLAFFLPLIIVSVTTLQFTGISSKEQLSDEYLGKSRSFGSQVASLLDSYTHSEDVNRPAFENQLADMAKVFVLDANVFSPNGRLIASSQPFIFESGLISPYLEPEAIRRVSEGQNLFITTDKVGGLTFNVCYATLRSSQRGELIGILALPFFQSLHSLEQVRISVLANILNVFSVIFIVLIVLSFLVSEWLTFPLRFITHSLSKTSLTRTNEPLRWQADDEIGVMVKEYNQMLYKLSESKAELEQTQRERAWREIAQQVAHEIKNPLTPMKLTLQQLERSLESGAEMKEKTLRAVSSLLSQVETLNDIASSFSSFAKMPEPEIARIELVQLMKRIVLLHVQSGPISLSAMRTELFVNGDEQLLGRIFSNLILNAFQSARPGVPLRVEVQMEVVNDAVRILFRDNGKGIDSRLIGRVFVPHFSTKRSGSGLGLAISKQGIEHMRGKIWFETEANVGTVFYIELPLAK